LLALGGKEGRGDTAMRNKFKMSNRLTKLALPIFLSVILVIASLATMANPAQANLFVCLK
jgi:hypothetical protein